MRYLTAAMVGLFLLAGCSWIGSRSEDDKPPPPVGPDRIEIMGFLKMGNGAEETRFIFLNKSGPCFALINAGLFSQGSKVELPPETFEECRALLAKTDFFHMKSARPQGTPGVMSRSINIRHDNQEHAVEERMPERAGPGFDALMQFILERTTPRRG